MVDQEFQAGRLRRTSRWTAKGLGLAALLMASSALAGPGPSVRTGDHPGFGRVVFELPDGAGFRTTRTGDRVVVEFDTMDAIPGAAKPPRNVAGVQGGQGRAELTLLPGARLRTARIGNRVILDVLDPDSQAGAADRPAAERPDAAPTPAPAPRRRQAERSRPNAPLPTVPQIADAPVSGDAAAATALGAAQAAVPVPAQAGRSGLLTLPASNPAAAIGPATAPIPAPTIPVQQTNLPAPGTGDAAQKPGTGTAAGAAPRAPEAPAPEPLSSPSLSATRVLLAFSDGVGVASWPCGEAACVLFDERRDVDASSLHGSGIVGEAKVQLLPAATLLRLPLLPGAVPQLAKVASGWRITLGSAAASGPGVEPRQAASGVMLPLASPGRTVAVPDGESGQTLLVGTSRIGTAAGIAGVRRMPEFALRRTWLGVAVEPVSDRLVLRPVTDGYTLSSEGVMLAGNVAVPAPVADAASLTRRFDLPALPSEALLRRAQSAREAAAMAPPLARFRPRLEAAQALLALGMGAEAKAVLDVARADDPQRASEPDAVALDAVAVLLAGRVQEADGLDDPRLTGTDEVALWRAVKAATRKESDPAAAAAMPKLVPLILSYPSALRTRLLPLAAESLALGGAASQADALLASLPDEPLLTYARAIRQEAKGEVESALAAYDALGAGRDRLMRVRAGRRAVEARMAGGKLTPEAGADALERLSIGWRGDARERGLRIRAAELRTQAGQWRTALDGLKETATLFPADRDLVRAGMRGVLLGMLHAPNVKPLDLVVLAGENADVVPDGDEGEALSALLADKLLALDLPERAAPVLTRLARAAKPGPARAALGARLAALQLGQGDGPAALTTLADTDAADLSAELKERRGLIAARATARGGDLAGALVSLAGVGTASADDARADLLEQAKDWRGLAGALGDLAAKRLPKVGALDDAQQGILLRQASAAAQAGDDGMLRTLRGESQRVTGPRADMFRLLVSEPVRSTVDLPRAASDVVLARAVAGRTGLAAR